MRLWSYGLGFSVALGVGLAAGGGCAAGKTGNASGVGGAGAGSSGTGNMGGGTMLTTSSGSSGSTGSGITDASVPDGLGACGSSHAEAKQAPAAMLVLLQGSSSMNHPTIKWPAAQQAVIQAIDQDVFDTMSLGLLAWPSLQTVTGPACIFGLPVYCGAPGLPQVPINLAGMNKSSASSGVRHDMYSFLTAVNPIPDSADPGNSTPLYDAINNGYAALKGVNIEKRILAVLTDGGGSCTSISSPLRPNYQDNNMCPDWEQPANLNALISKNQQDPTTPIDTFIVGLPGSNSHGETVMGYDTAPYSMLLALSTYAVSGSPNTVDPTCDKTAVFTKPGTDPAHPCHIDLSNGANFNAMALATAISTLRGKALGCVYDIPPAPPGQTYDANKVNVVETLNGMEYLIPKRSNPTDMCLGGNPCWDFDAMGKIVLIGSACSQVSMSTSAKVDIYFGCATQIK